MRSGAAIVLVLPRIRVVRVSPSENNVESKHHDRLPRHSTHDDYIKKHLIRFGFLLLVRSMFHPNVINFKQCTHRQVELQ